MIEIEGIISLDGLESCIVGVVEEFGQEPKLLYDTQKILTELQLQGMTEEEAVEYYTFNIIGGYFGKQTPCFLVERAEHAPSQAPS